MRINTKVVIDMLTDEVVHRESFDYSGPLAEAVTGTSVTKVASTHVAGGLMEVYTAFVDPGSIAARAEELETFAITGARPNDPVWVDAEDPDAMLIIKGSQATTDLVTVWMENNYDLTTAVDAATLRVNIKILRRTNVSS